MRVYFESSVVLRVVLGETGRLKEWSRASAALTSEITRVECLRTLDRLRLSGGLHAWTSSGTSPPRLQRNAQRGDRASRAAVSRRRRSQRVAPKEGRARVARPELPRVETRPRLET
jgi:hypothetical protein